MAAAPAVQRGEGRAEWGEEVDLVGEGRAEWGEGRTYSIGRGKGSMGLSETREEELGE